MNCPSCGARVPGGRPSCPTCGALLAPPTEGALAPEAAPPPPSKTEPLRQIPALQKREKATWKDEVRERVRHRRRRRAGEEGDELPLFEEPPSPRADAPQPLPQLPAEAREWALGGDAASRSDEDLPLRPAEEDPGAALDDTIESPASSGQVLRGAFDQEESEGDEWSLGGGPAAEPRPVERPAYPGERAQAAAIDAAFLGALSSLVVYFASRRAGVPLAALKPVWPYLAAYLAFLGLFYASYFTGATGQTLGKLVKGLRVADRSGAPPSYSRAAFRAALGALGIALALLGLVPMLFDPARRALHDRVFKTRVVHG
jgi:uncharacterized RDD family membrane protein YckC